MIRASTRPDLQLGPGTGHELSVAGPQGDASTRYLFARWSDGGDQTHMFTASLAHTVVAADFIVQHHVDTGVDPPGSGTVSLDPPSPDGFYTLRSPGAVAATSEPGFFFVGWFGLIFSPVHGFAANPTAFLNSIGGVSYQAFFSDSPPTLITTNQPGRARAHRRQRRPGARCCRPAAGGNPDHRCAGDGATGAQRRDAVGISLLE